jgi:hypothetical protein
MPQQISFEETVRRRCIFSLDYIVAKAGSFNTLEDFQRYAVGQDTASPKQIRALANFFKIKVPPGYATEEKAA